MTLTPRPRSRKAPPATAHDAVMVRVTQALREQEVQLTALAHDLKNPLSVIQMQAYKLHQGDEADRARADVIQRAGDQMLQLINRLQSLAKQPLADLQTDSPEAAS